MTIGKHQSEIKTEELFEFPSEMVLEQHSNSDAWNPRTDVWYVGAFGGQTATYDIMKLGEHTVMFDGIFSSKNGFGPAVFRHLPKGRYNIQIISDASNVFSQCIFLKDVDGKYRYSESVITRRNAKNIDINVDYDGLTYMCFASSSTQLVTLSDIIITKLDEGSVE